MAGAPEMFWVRGWLYKVKFKVHPVCVCLCVEGVDPAYTKKVDMASDLENIYGVVNFLPLNFDVTHFCPTIKKKMDLEHGTKVSSVAQD